MKQKGRNKTQRNQGMHSTIPLLTNAQPMPEQWLVPYRLWCISSLLDTWQMGNVEIKQSSQHLWPWNLGISQKCNLFSPSFPCWSPSSLWLAVSSVLFWWWLIGTSTNPRTSPCAICPAQRPATAPPSCPGYWTAFWMGTRAFPLAAAPHNFILLAPQQSLRVVSYRWCPVIGTQQYQTPSVQSFVIF